MKRELDPISGRAIEVANNIGLWGRLNRTPKSLGGLAEDLGCSERGLRPLLHLLAATGLVRAESDGFRLAAGALRYVRKKWASAYAAFPEIPEYEGLEQAVRTGRPVRPPVEGSADEGAFFATVVPTLFDLHLPDAQYLASQIPDSVQRVLDLGAGSGVWSLALAVQRPDVRVVAVDRPQVLDGVTRDFLLRHRVLEQYELWPGDYHQVKIPEGGFDLVLLGHLLHADGWEGSRQLLARACSALRAGGYLAVAEIVASEPRDQEYAPNVFDLSMLMLTENGVVFSRRELSGLVAEAGLVDASWIQGPGEYPLLLARRPA